MSRALSHGRPAAKFWLLATYLTFVFLLGGSAYDDAASLLALRPLSVVMCGVAIVCLPPGSLRSYRGLLCFAGAMFALAVIQLIPLPPSIWSALPGRAVVVDIDALAGLSGTWRPISLDPHGTWNALYSLSVPLAALLLGISLNRDERYALLAVVVVLGMASGLLGVLQAGDGGSRSLYFYRTSTPGMPSGLFSNRNHQAALLACLFPMLAVLGWTGPRAVEQIRMRTTLVLAAGALLIPLLMVTGSRAGFALGLLGLGTVPFLYRRLRPKDGAARKRRRRSLLVSALFGSVGVSIMGLLAVLFARAAVIDRLLAPDQAADFRFKVWGPLTELALRYLPFGTGLGSFDVAFRFEEPDALLETTYLNHAHNDWLEIALTGGIPAIILAAIALGWWVVMTIRAWRGDGARRDVSYQRLGSIIVVMLALASVTDYPLRVPSMMCVFAVAALWLQGTSASRSNVSA